MPSVPLAPEIANGVPAVPPPTSSPGMVHLIAPRVGAGLLELSVRTCDVPRLSYTVIGVENSDVASAAAVEFRFRSTVKLVVGDGGLQRTHRHDDVADRPVCIHLSGEGIDRRPSLYAVSGVGQQVARLVRLEVAGTGVERVPAVILDDEESVTLYGRVEQAGAGLNGPLGKCRRSAAGRCRIRPGSPRGRRRVTG